MSHIFLILNGALLVGIKLYQIHSQKLQLLIELGKDIQLH